jgi:hypothetical protein
MRRISFIFLVGLGITGICTKLLKLETYFDIFLGLFIPILMFYYTGKKKNDNLEPEYAVIGGLILLFVSDILELSYFKDFIFKDKIQIVLHLLVQFLFLTVFRKEGAILVQESKVDVFKIFIPALLVFLMFGYFVFEENEILNYFLLIVFAIQLAIFLILTMFRPVNNYSFYFGVAGVSFLLLYGLFYFLFTFGPHHKTFYDISFSFYVFSQVFLIESFSTNVKTEHE